MEDLEKLAEKLDISVVIKNSIVFLEYGVGGCVKFSTIEDAMNALILLDEK